MAYCISQKTGELVEINDGDRVTVKWPEIVEGRISIYVNKIYWCQNVAEGQSCDDKKGYKYSWAAGYCPKSTFKIWENLDAHYHLKWEEFTKI